MISKAPSNTIIEIIGASQSFLRNLKKAKSSLSNSIGYIID